MTYEDAHKIALQPYQAVTDADLVAAWHAHASKISYHHADDSGREWPIASLLIPTARSLEAEIKRRGLPRPTGEYLLSARDRLEWAA